MYSGLILVAHYWPREIVYCLGIGWQFYVWQLIRPQEKMKLQQMSDTKSIPYPNCLKSDVKILFHEW